MRLQPLSLLLAGLCLLCGGPPAHAQKGKIVRIVLKDGFTVHGKVKQEKDVIIDPASGVSIPIAKLGSSYTLDDEVRNIAFSPSPSQILTIIREDADANKNAIRLTNVPPATGDPPPGTWTLISTSPFDDKWERTVTMNMGKGTGDIKQRLVVFTPFYAHVYTRNGAWTQCYLTREWGPDTARELVYKYVKMRDLLKTEFDKRLLVYRFYLQAGWSAQAEEELKKMLEVFPSQRKKLEGMQDNLNELLAAQFVKDTEQAHKAGQHVEVQERLARFAAQKMVVPAQMGLRMAALKLKYNAAAEKLKDVQRHLKALPADVNPVRRDFYKEATAAILEGVNHDTLPRLETFLGQAQDAERRRANKQPPTNTPDELLAFAISGWLLGDGAAEKNPQTARELWKARELVLRCQRGEDPIACKQAAASFAKEKKVGVDVVARMIPLLPPPAPHDKLGTEPIAVTMANGGGYAVQLPPEYHHHRAYPVLLALHHSGEKPADELTRWGELAARHGFIVAAPAWGGRGRAEYQYSAREHAAVLGCLRDLRRRFQVDSDRVFLFGCEQGGQAAYDIGLSHPDLFAGVLPMSATPRFFTFPYWSNGQHLPVYATIGDHTGQMVKNNRTLFKDWIRKSYPSILVEYKGRAAECFDAECERMMDWMSRKKRHYPQKELGSSGEEFKTMRETDTRFYWLSAEGVLPRFQNDAAVWVQGRPPATLRAHIFRENQINVWATGVQNVTLWLGPGSINYGEKTKLYMNSRLARSEVIAPSLEVLLDDFCRTGDRQRLFWARVDLRP